MCPGILHTRWEIKCPHEKEAFAEKIVLGRNAAGLRGWKGECSCTSPLGLWKPWDGHGGGGGGVPAQGPQEQGWCRGRMDTKGQSRSNRGENMGPLLACPGPTLVSVHVPVILRSACWPGHSREVVSGSWETPSAHASTRTPRGPRLRHTAP